MNIKKLHYYKIPSTLAEVYIVYNILNKRECKEACDYIKNNSKRSHVVAPPDQVKEGIVEIVHDHRTSSSATFPQDHKICQKVRKGISDIIKNDADLPEHIQGHLYNIGGKYDHHFDFFENLELDDLTVTRGNRSYTCLVYLNEDMIGGETDLPNLKLKIKPKTGMAVIWKNLYDDNTVNRDTLHAGLPVIDGEKYILTQWYRENKKPKPITYNMTPSNQFSSKEELPRLTVQGFWKEKIPDQIWKKIVIAYDTLKSQPEMYEGDMHGFIENPELKQATTLLSLDSIPDLRDEIHQDFLPFFEKWFNQNLEKATFFGIRSYRKGTTLAMHTDRVAELHASGIIMIEQKQGAPWGLDVQDYEGKWHNVVIEPGEILLYESAKLPHGRITPFTGDFYRNCYVHFRLKDWQYVPK